jgi:hypothetical protein
VGLRALERAIDPPLLEVPGDQPPARWAGDESAEGQKEGGAMTQCPSCGLAYSCRCSDSTLRRWRDDHGDDRFGTFDASDNFRRVEDELRDRRRAEERREEEREEERREEARAARRREEERAEQGRAEAEQDQPVDDDDGA